VLNILKAIFVLNAPHSQFGKTMNYHNIPFIIPMLAGGYVLTVYVLLILAQRVAKMANRSSWRSGVAESQTKS
jgi:hypothetical protein